jgi:hypothetical protein
VVVAIYCGRAAATFALNEVGGSFDQ